MSLPSLRLWRLLALLPLCAACSGMPDVAAQLTPYRVDVRQGNFVTQDMVAQLRPGLTRDQVCFILGSPLIVDIFHADRWDYVYRFQGGGGQVVERRLTVFFEDSRLTRVAGDVIANLGETESVRPAARIVEIPAPTKPAEGGRTD